MPICSRRDKAAKRLVDEAGAIRKLNVEKFPAAYVFAAIPSRYALERGDWKSAAELQLLPAELAWDKFPQAEADSRFCPRLGGRPQRRQRRGARMCKGCRR